MIDLFVLIDYFNFGQYIYSFFLFLGLSLISFGIIFFLEKKGYYKY
ncbi:hypothetical protein GRFL_2677 [Christiangramia flava JLT2011]|uniref:Uncharacterized protein n=1 Tax=Christiangramia flava JLT2011 TaxID=1229726 RepID=A0A1L7I720_9FLAO|nr:hypothetical protein GRFL_2677 [Christiangramia flava JLT2011]